MVRKRSELGLRYTSPPPEGRIVVNSVPAAIELGHPHVGELSQPEIQRSFTQRGIPLQKARKGPRAVSHQLEDIEYAARDLLQAPIDALQLARNLAALDIR